MARPTKQCSTCGEAKETTCRSREGSSNRKTLAVDHCHNSLKVRGLLCNKCNVAIGLMNDDYKLVKIAYNYLYDRK